MSFIDAPLSGTLTVDGDHSISAPAGSQVVAEVAGSLGDSQITLGYQTLSGEFKAYRSNGADLQLTDGDAVGVQVTGKGEVVFRVVGLGEGFAVRYRVTPVIQANRE